MAADRAVSCVGGSMVEAQSIHYPRLALGNTSCHHGVTPKVASINVCGIDQRTIQGRTTAPYELILGHEITGEAIECCRDVEFLKVGDIVSVPFNIANGRFAKAVNATVISPADIPKGRKARRDMSICVGIFSDQKGASLSASPPSKGNWTLLCPFC